MNCKEYNFEDKKLALLEEANIASSFIHYGKKSMDILEEDDFFQAPFLLISYGFERLLKLIIILDFFYQSGKFPDKKEFNKDLELKTHDIEKLLTRVVKIAKEWDYQNRALEAKKDIVFLENISRKLDSDNLPDSDNINIIKLMTEYNKESRYFYLNAIGNIANKFGNPANRIYSYFKRDKKELITFLQQIERALFRMFRSGNLGENGKEIADSRIASSIIDWPDEELGDIAEY